MDPQPEADAHLLPAAHGRADLRYLGAAARAHGKAVPRADAAWRHGRLAGIQERARPLGRRLRARPGHRCEEPLPRPDPRAVQAWRARIALPRTERGAAADWPRRDDRRVGAPQRRPHAGQLLRRVDDHQALLLGQLNAGQSPDRILQTAVLSTAVLHLKGETAMSHVMNTYARQPVAFVRGQGVWLWDEAGKKYLDALSGIAVNT